MDSLICKLDDEWIEKKEHLLSQKDIVIDYFDDTNGQEITNTSAGINETIESITQNNKHNLI